MEWSSEKRVWFDICAGRRCSICEALLHVSEGGPQRGFHYCRTCSPDSGRLPHCVHVAFDHQVGGMSVTLASDEDPRVVLWLVRVPPDRVLHIAQRGRVANCQLRNLERSITQWQRGCLYTHLDDAQYANLVATWRRDPRNGSEKQRDLESGPH